MIAYLVVREDNKWRDIYRLMPGQVITVGRAATNRIALQDEVCSRNHCELYHSEGAWVLRDLGSRNGTYVEGTAVTGDCPLEPGQLIEIGACKLAFTDDLSRAFPILDEESSGVEDDTGTAFEDVLDHPPPMTEPAIIHRRRRTRFRITTDRDPIAVDRTSQVLAQLYRLALEMGSAKRLPAIGGGRAQRPFRKLSGRCRRHPVAARRDRSGEFSRIFECRRIPNAK